MSCIQLCTAVTFNLTLSEPCYMNYLDAFQNSRGHDDDLLAAFESFGEENSHFMPFYVHRSLDISSSDSFSRCMYTCVFPSKVETTRQSRCNKTTCRICGSLQAPQTPQTPQKLRNNSASATFRRMKCRPIWSCPAGRERLWIFRRVRK